MELTVSYFSCEDNKLGQNGFLMSAGQHHSQTPDISKVVQAWYQEINWYNYHSNTCDKGRVCGHFTQARYYLCYYIFVAVHLG